MLSVVLLKRRPISSHVCTRTRPLLAVIGCPWNACPVMSSGFKGWPFRGSSPRRSSFKKAGIPPGIKRCSVVIHLVNIWESRVASSPPVSQGTEKSCKMWDVLWRSVLWLGVLINNRCTACFRPALTTPAARISLQKHQKGFAAATAWFEEEKKKENRVQRCIFLMSYQTRSPPLPPLPPLVADAFLMLVQ